ncbi:Phenylalanine--tRNA ligase beta subunit [archaeon HR01]|nr:Phenylalanine--tRNA ligase beta subunit [archaeon HR01]
MPVVNLRLSKLSALLGREVSVEQLTEMLASLGLSVEEVADGVAKVEYNPNRPDFSSTYGIARALRGVLGLSLGVPRYRLRPGRFTVYVEPSVADVRPYIACAVVRGLKVWADDLEEFIAMQEDLHWVLGRNRRVVAIGLHNLEPLRPPIRYRAVGLDEVRFRPLKGEAEMTPRSILADHETGRKYAHLVGEKAAILMDGDGKVFSMPPVINAALTELRPGTRDLFIDVTGLDREKVGYALNILVSAFADAGGVVERVRVSYPDGSKTYPDLRPGKMYLDVGYAGGLLGLKLDSRSVVRLLKMSRMDASAAGRGRVKVVYPAYRVDILHPVDLVEEIAIAYGYSRMVPELPGETTFGSLLPSTEGVERLAEIMVGLGYTEVVNLLLTNEKAEYYDMGDAEAPHVKLANPATREYTMLRTSILPSLLHNLASNQRNLYPQKIFEVGVVVHPSQDTPERAVKRRRLAAATCHSLADYTEVKQVADELMRLLGYEARYRPWHRPPFIEGRCASLEVSGLSVGVLGEVSPHVLERLGLAMPVAAMEIYLDELAASVKH